MKEFQGIGVSEGTASGPVLVLQFKTTENESINPQEQDLNTAMEKFFQGRDLMHCELIAMSREVKTKFGHDKAGIYEGYAEILMDDEIEDLVRAYVKEGYSTETAAQKAFLKQVEEFESLKDEYMRERGRDLADIGRRFAAVIERRGQNAPLVLKEPCILVGNELSLFEIVGLDQSKIIGLAMDRGGYTSHVAILARSLGIPCVVGLENLSAQLRNGTLCALDGNSGRFIIEPAREILDSFYFEDKEQRKKPPSLTKYDLGPALTKDGVSIIVCANIGSLEEAKQAAIHGADGVGVFRTELMYMKSGHLPSEEEQFNIYQQVWDAMNGKIITIRTLDIGGDKEYPDLNLKKEDNPFLGYRAIRLSLDRPDLIKPQVRAILRTAALGNVELMLPLIATLDEIRRVRSIVEECCRELAIQEMLPIGIMVETPAAALMAREFAVESDFFSIGTNDLAQYTLAADRGNARIANLYDQLDPAVLRLIALTSEAAAEAGIQVGICGELAADPKALPLLIGLGMTKLSVSPSRISNLKAELRSLEVEKCLSLAKKALTLPTAAAVHELLSLV